MFQSSLELEDKILWCIFLIIIKSYYMSSTFSCGAVDCPVQDVSPSSICILEGSKQCLFMKYNM